MMTPQLVRRQLTAYQDAWKEVYQSAQECPDCEDFIRMGLFVFGELRRLNAAWRERVFKGRSPYDRETDRLIRSLFSGWLEVSSNLLRRNVARLSADHRVEGADALTAMQAEAIDVLHSWKAPKPSVLPGMRRHVLDVGHAAELEGLDSANNASRAPSPCDVSYEEFCERRENLQSAN